MRRQRTQTCRYSVPGQALAKCFSLNGLAGSKASEAAGLFGVGICDASSPLWERACSRRHHWGLPERSRRLLREQARSHIKGCCFKSGYCLCCSQGNVRTTRMPLFQLGVYGGYVLGGSVVFAAGK